MPDEFLLKEIMDTKICNTCETEKTLDNFYKKLTKFQARCKDCCKVYRPTCISCLQEFRTEDKKAKYCSRACRIKKVVKNCFHCKVVIKVPKHKLKINNFCSQDCYFAERNKDKCESDKIYLQQETRICKSCNEEKPLNKFGGRIRDGKLLCPNICNLCKTKIVRKGAPNPVSIGRNDIKEGQETKVCVRCNEEKPLYSFSPHKRKTGIINRAAKCSSCATNRPVGGRKLYAPYQRNGIWIKFCCACRTTKTIEEFNKFRGGYRYCKPCNAKKSREFLRNATLEQKEKIRIAAKKSRIKNYPLKKDERNAKMREYRKRPEVRKRINARQRIYMTPEKRREYYKKPSYRIALKRGGDAYRSRKLGAEIVIPFTKADIIKRDGLNCYLCHKLLTIKTATVDHVLPLVRGGNHKAENAKIACLSCNSSKNKKTLTEYKKYRGDYDRFRISAISESVYL